MERYKKAADEGHASAQLKLGRMYESGDGGGKDARCAGTGARKKSMKAMGGYRNAAEQGHAGAQRQLAECYRTGSGVEQNTEKAKE